MILNTNRDRWNILLIESSNPLSPYIQRKISVNKELLLWNYVLDVRLWFCYLQTLVLDCLLCSTAWLYSYIHIYVYRSRQYIILRHKIHRELLWISTSAIVWTRHYVVRTGWICHQCRTWRHRICPSGRGNPHIAHWHSAIHPTTNISTMQFLMILI